MSTIDEEEKKKVRESVPQRKAAKKPPSKKKKLIKGQKNVNFGGAAEKNGPNSKRYKKADRAREKMEALNYDPLNEVIKVARGEALTTNHPFIPIAKARLEGWIQRIERNLRISREEVELFREQLKKSLTDSWVPIELRNKNNLELLKYAHPQLKATDVRQMDVTKVPEVKALTKKDVETFSKWFNEKY